MVLDTRLYGIGYDKRLFLLLVDVELDIDRQRENDMRYYAMWY